MTPYSEETLLQAFDTVEEIVSLGGYHDNAEAIERLDALPRDLTPTGAGELTLFRVYALDATAYTELVGPGLRITHAAVTSWTRSRLATRMILRGALRRPGVHRAVAITRTIAREHLLVDVPALYRRLGFDDECVESWDLYARWEQEVFLHGLPPIDLTAADILEIADPSDPEAHRPLAGERIWIEAIETMATILEIDGGLRLVEGEAHWTVTTDADETGLAAYDHRHHSWNLRRRRR